jgi:protocadherin Fat 4
LKVKAADGGNPSLSSTVTVYMNVIDRNDNAPIFDPVTYSVQIYENVTIGSSIVTVRATDVDSGKYRNVLSNYANMQQITTVKQETSISSSLILLVT